MPIENGKGVGPACALGPTLALSALKMKETAFCGRCKTITKQAVEPHPEHYVFRCDVCECVCVSGKLLAARPMRTARVE